MGGHRSSGATQRILHQSPRPGRFSGFAASLIVKRCVVATGLDVRVLGRSLRSEFAKAAAIAGAS
jgi:hypothetical protein